MKFSAALLVLSSFVLASSAATTPGDVKTDVSAVVDKVVILDKATTALPAKGATIDQFLAIQNTGHDLGNSLVKFAADVKTIDHPLTDAEAVPIFNTIKNSAAPVIEHCLTTIAAKKAAFVAAGLSVVTKQDLNALNAQADNFVSALITIAPDDIKDEARTLKLQMDNVFSKAISVF